MRLRRALLIGSLLLPAASIVFCGPRDSLGGTWRLVEQSYGAGSRNLSAEDPPLFLELSGRDGTPAGRIWSGDDEGAAVDWPGFVTDGGPLPVEVIERRGSFEAGFVEARYRVRPSDRDELRLDIVERYELTGDGLTGTLRVRFTGGEYNRGGFTLHRRFVRVR